MLVPPDFTSRARPEGVDHSRSKRTFRAKYSYSLNGAPTVVENWGDEGGYELDRSAKLCSAPALRTSHRLVLIPKQCWLQARLNLQHKSTLMT